MAIASAPVGMVLTGPLIVVDPSQQYTLPQYESIGAGEDNISRVWADHFAQHKIIYAHKHGTSLRVVAS